MAEQFAKGAGDGTGSNMFIQNDTIYSYGKHFKIAVRLNPAQKFATNVGYVYNSDTYSPTTNKHQAHVRSAIDHDYIALPQCNFEEQFLMDYIQELRNDLDKEIVRLQELQARYKSQKKIDFYNDKIIETKETMTDRIKEVEFFKVALYGGQAVHFIRESA